MMPQAIPPTPPTPPLDPNLIFMQHSGPPTEFLITLIVMIAAVIILWPLMRALGRRLEGKGDNPALKAELEDLRQQLGDVDALRHQMTELEERIDFAERLLAQTHDPQSKVLRGGPS
jgi:Tfp pilus assembly protein PilO